jgi:hypothetical protein
LERSSVYNLVPFPGRAFVDQIAHQAKRRDSADNDRHHHHR